jgi:hypothetical protein
MGAAPMQYGLVLAVLESLMRFWGPGRGCLHAGQAKGSLPAPLLKIIR